MEPLSQSKYNKVIQKKEGENDMDMGDYVDATLACYYYCDDTVDCDYDYDWLSDGSDKDENKGDVE